MLLRCFSYSLHPGEVKFRSTDRTAECTRNGNYGILPRPTEIQTLGVETNNMCVNEFPRFDINVNMSITDLNYSDDVLVTFLTVGKNNTQRKLPKGKNGFSLCLTV